MNMLDTRDLQDRIDGLELEDYDELDDEDRAELDELLALCEEFDGYGEWRYLVLLIDDQDFVKYAQDFAEGIGTASRDAEWPYNNIDWKLAAAELRMDYTCVEYDGRTYWYR